MRVKETLPIITEEAQRIRQTQLHPPPTILRAAVMTAVPHRIPVPEALTAEAVPAAIRTALLLAAIRAVPLPAAKAPEAAATAEVNKK